MKKLSEIIHVGFLYFRRVSCICFLQLSGDCSKSNIPMSCPALLLKMRYMAIFPNTLKISLTIRVDAAPAHIWSNKHTLPHSLVAIGVLLVRDRKSTRL